MIKILLLTIAIMMVNEHNIKISHVEHKEFGSSISVNAKIIQLSNQKQQIVSKLRGHLEHYFVQIGENVKKGDKIAEIDSLELSHMSATFISLSKELNVAKKRLYNTRKLYKKGLSSMQDLSAEEMAISGIESKRNSLKSQLNSLEIDLNTLKKATDTFTIYAHADGKIDQLLVSLHANIDAQTPIVSLVQESGYYAEAYLPVEKAMQSTKDIKATLKIANRNYPCKFISLLPQVDETTGQAKMLFWIESKKDRLLLNSYAKMQILQSNDKHFVVVKKSALSMFDSEWVVFIPHEDEEHHEEHEGHDKLDDHDEEEEHSAHDEHEEHKEDSKHDEHGHDDHEDEEVPFSLQVVKKLHSFGDEIAVEGIHEGEEYVSDGVYFVKSMLLKSKLGGHGH